MDHEELLKSLSERSNRYEGYYGVRTADQWLGPMLDCVGDEAASKTLWPDVDFSKVGMSRETLMKEAAGTLTYANEDMVRDGELLTTTSAMEDYAKDAGFALPPRTIMVFENIVTTPRKDRDGDILRTEGAEIDKAMPLLWHHMLPMPIGKMLKVLQHNKQLLKVATAVADNELGNDAAALVEFGALRISHGFRPIKFEMLPRSGDDLPGFDFQKFEIMEESLVSVPSNVDAAILAFSRGKLHSPMGKSFGKHLFDARPKTFTGVTINTDGSVTKTDTESKSTVTVQQNSDGSTQIWSETADRDGDGNAEDEKDGVASEGSEEKAFLTPETFVKGMDLNKWSPELVEEAAAKFAEHLEKDGRVFSKANEKALESIGVDAQAVVDKIGGLLGQIKKPEVGEPEDPDKVADLLPKLANALLVADEHDKDVVLVMRGMLSLFVGKFCEPEVPTKHSTLAVQNGRLQLVTD